ncbi:hypothetical protein QVM62_29395, partial [Pseudomonas putida]|uniref:hypothetical protein n=1 Tax=Pseudomonas putida TaxID=303 RepID=UPI003523C5B8
CFMEKLGWRDRRISPDSGSLFQTFPKAFLESWRFAEAGTLITAPQLYCADSREFYRAMSNQKVSGFK